MTPEDCGPSTPPTLTGEEGLGDSENAAVVIVERVRAKITEREPRLALAA